MTIRLIIILLPHSPSIEGGAPPREGVHPVPQGDPEALTLERRVGPGRVDPNHADEPGLDDPQLFIAGWVSSLSELPYLDYGVYPRGR